MPSRVGSAQFRDSVGKTRRPLLKGNITGNVLSFYTTLQGFTDAKIEFYTVSDIYSFEGEDPVSSPFGMVELAAICNFRESNGTLWRLSIPAPKESIIEEVEGKGYRIKKSSGDTLATAFGGLYGKTFTFEEGWICGHVPVEL